MTIHWKAVDQCFTVVLFVNPLTLRVKPWVMQSFLTFDSMEEPQSVTIHRKDAEQYFTVVLFDFQFYPVCNFRKSISFGRGAIRSERVKWCIVNTPHSFSSASSSYAYGAYSR